MKYLPVLIAAVLLSACSESPEENAVAENPVTSADASHAHDGDTHSHDDGAEHSHASSETEVFYGDQAESASEVGTVGGPSVTGLDHGHEHDESDAHHEAMHTEELSQEEHSHEEHSDDEKDVHQHEESDHHHDDAAEDHSH